ncbi:MAG: hypothetical protein LBD75_05875 [Candidatus Peribacteria bacterium]|jgi:hypothetical protein|nr:hypothetical protein [Candidatus Peribacteria bacterium]
MLLKKIGFHLSTGETIKREKISLSEGQYWTTRLKDGRIKMVIRVENTLYSKVFPQEEYPKIKKTIDKNFYLEQY